MKVFVSEPQDYDEDEQAVPAEVLLILDWPDLPSRIEKTSRAKMLSHITKTMKDLLTVRVTVRLDDECPKCGSVMEVWGSNSLSCANPKCEDGKPTVIALRRLMTKFPFRKDEPAGDYFDRLTAEWKREK